jgi:hypothetical protein
VAPVSAPAPDGPAVDRPAVPALRIPGLTKRFGTALAVDRLDLDVPAGSLFGLVGRNGAGKTTTLSMATVSATTLRALLHRFVSGGGTAVVSSHVMQLVEQLCDHAGIIVGGRVVAAGAVDAVRGGATLEERFVALAGGARDAGGTCRGWHRRRADVAAARQPAAGSPVAGGPRLPRLVVAAGQRRPAGGRDGRAARRPGRLRRARRHRDRHGGHPGLAAAAARPGRRGRDAGPRPVRPAPAVPVLASRAFAVGVLARRRGREIVSVVLVLGITGVALVPALLGEVEKTVALDGRTGTVLDLLSWSPLAAAWAAPAAAAQGDGLGALGRLVVAATAVILLWAATEWAVERRVRPRRTGRRGGGAPAGPHRLGGRLAGLLPDTPAGPWRRGP